MFGQNNRRIVIECYRSKELTPSFEDTTDPYKYHQNNRIKKRGKKVIFDLCECHEDAIDDNLYGQYQPKTWDSITEWYGNADTTEVWPTLEERRGRYGIDEYNGMYQEARPYKSTKKKPRKRKSKTYKKRGHHLNKQKSNLNSYNPAALDPSVISLYRKRKKVPRHSLKKKVEKSTKCPYGLCTGDKALENKNFKCSCIDGIKESRLAPAYTDTTSNFSRQSRSTNSIVKFKDNVLSLCRKCSQNFLKKSPDADQENNHKTKTNLTDFISCVKQALKNKHNIEGIKAHESEQTGDPFFEVQVNSRDMCILNPKEIKENIIRYGKTEKREPSCICPSRGILSSDQVCEEGLCKKAFKNKQVNFKCYCDKKIQRITECRDTTCGITNVENKGIFPYNSSLGKMRLEKNKHVTFQKVNKPLLQVQLDMDKMCVMNPKEIQEKIKNNVSLNEVCSSGVCRNAALIQNIPFKCHCVSRKLIPDITECTGDTCKDVTKKKRSKFCLFCTRICSKSENWPFQSRVQRRSFYEIGPNKLCRGKLCTQSGKLSKKEVANSKNIDLKSLPRCTCQEYNDLCRGKLRSQSDNLFNKKVANSNNIDLKHLPACNCQECNLTKTASKRRRDIHEISRVITQKVKKKNVMDKNARRKGISVRVSNKDKLKHKGLKGKHKKTDKKKEVDDIKARIKKAKENAKLERIKEKQRQKQNKIDQKKFRKEAKRRAKLDRKAEKIAEKERRKAIRTMLKKMKEEPSDTNFCSACIIGVLKLVLKTMLFIIQIIFTIIRKPKKSYWYVRDRLKNPEGTYKLIRNWVKDAILIKKLQISETARGSDTMNILGDAFMDTALYQTFADRGKTKAEQALFEQQNKARKRRIRKREQQAITSCRHTLLTTLRKTPCLWVYHICPNFYPQCLSFLALMRSFILILTFLAAFACWTPCILAFELCRAFLCCFMCTG